jgi:hypothetical protein
MTVAMVSRVCRAVGIAALAALLCAPTPAHAGEIDRSEPFLLFQAEPGEVNALTVTVRDGEVEFTDLGAPIDNVKGGADCTSPGGATVVCRTSRLRIKVRLGDRDDTVELKGGPAKADGEGGSDTLVGGPGADGLDGGTGDDVLQGGGGTDSYTGGDGFDRIDYLDHSAPVTASFDGLANDGSAGENELLPADAEYVFGSPGADTLSAGAAGSALHGGPGTDLLLGGAGDDIIYGGKDADELRGGAGVDRMWGDLGSDRVYSADGNAESVECGDDFDWAQSDLLDTLSGCEDSGEAPAGVDGGIGGPGGSAGGGFGAGGPEAVPPPQLGRSVTVEPVGGVVTVRPPGGDATKLAAGGDIPLGSLVDTTRGAVEVTAAANAGGKTQTAQFKGGLFQVRQGRGSKPVTELVLKGTLDCRAGPRRGKVVAAAKRRTRRLWGSGHGSFRTRGRHGSATVRGTVWLTEDRCGGTYTRVKRGVVAVDDFAAKRTVLVRAGKSYFAKRR